MSSAVVSLVVPPNTEGNDDDQPFSCISADVYTKHPDNLTLNGRRSLTWLHPSVEERPCLRGEGRVVGHVG